MDKLNLGLFYSVLHILASILNALEIIKNYIINQIHLKNISFWAILLQIYLIVNIIILKRAGNIYLWCQAVTIELLELQ